MLLPTTYLKSRRQTNKTGGVAWKTSDSPRVAWLAFIDRRKNGRKGCMKESMSIIYCV